MAVLRHPDVVSAYLGPNNAAAPNQRSDCPVRRDRSAPRRLDQCRRGQVVTLLGATAPANRPRCALSRGWQSRRRAKSCSTANRSPASDLKPLSGSASPMCRRGGGCSRPHRQGKHHARRLEPAHREIGAVARSRRHVRSVSGHQVIFQCARLDLVRRAIADGRGGARVDGEAAAVAAGRALARPRAGDRAGGVRIISEIRRNTTVLLVEQNARMGLSVADHGYVLETGRIVLGGKPDELWGNEASPPPISAVMRK